MSDTSEFSPLCFAGLLISLLVLIIIFTHFFPLWNLGTGSPIPTTGKQAIKALELMKDWSIWMATIQTGLLAALGTLWKEDRITVPQKYAAIATAIFTGAALFFSAWILSSLPSLAIRLGGCSLPMERCDFYEMSFYGWMKDEAYDVKFSFVASWGHILWALGLISFACFIVIGLASPRRSGLVFPKNSAFKKTN